MAGDDLADLVAKATYLPAEHEPDRTGRAKALAALIPVMAKSAKRAGFVAVAAGRWLSDEIIEIAPKLPVRDAATLRKQHPGLSDVEIAQKLIKNAKKTTAALG